ncbi:MAG: PQQ-binding-like beta-propeller repeat protein [Pararhodobacter sp.]
MPTPKSRRPAPPLLHRWAALIARVLAIVLGVLGAALVWVGGQIVGLGDTWYYLLAGIGLLIGAGLQLWGRFVWGAVLFGLVVLGTLGWSFFEIAGKGFLPSWGVDLAGRAGLLTGFVGLNIFVVLMGMVRPPRWVRPAAVVGLVGGIAAVVGLIAAFWERPTTPTGAGASAAAFEGHNSAGEWAHYGGSLLGAAHTPATQITPANTGDLAEAWRFQTGDMPPNDRVYFSAQNTPIYVEGRLFVCSPSNIVFALDPATGQEIWRFDPEVPAVTMESLFSVACRAVGYHPGPVAAPVADPEADAGTDPVAVPVTAPAETCGPSIYVTTTDSRLIALSAETGALCEGFGTGGTVDLAEGMGMQETGFASSTSGPAVVGDALIIGQQVSDNQRRDAPSGVVRAYDAATGDWLWAWDALRQGIANQPLAEGEIYPRGTPNVWNVISADPEAGLVYMGTGNSANDHFGGDRTPEEDRFTAAVVAVDVETGETVWDFATMERDVWDYDLGAQPALMDLELEDGVRRVLVQATKQGSIFVLDAATGEPVFPVEDRAAPQGGLPGETISPTQPHSVAFPNLSGLPGPEAEVIDPRHAWGLGVLDAAMCRRDFLRMDYAGIYTPPSENPHGMLLFPGTVGGMNWGGVGLDLGRQIVITNNSRLPNVVTMHPRAEVSDLPVGDGGARPDQEIAPHWLSPWGVTRPIWFSDLDMPCIAPPWGMMAATDLTTGELLWSQPIGTGYDSGPMGLPTRLMLPIGTATLGGPLVTATGLTFIASAQDDFLRAYETATGRLLWRARLPAGGQASPMSYVHEGRQYVVIGAAGHERLQTNVGDYVVAFALGE